MVLLKKYPVLFLGLIFAGVNSCKKDTVQIKDRDQIFVPKDILYLVKGTHLKLNYIDSKSVFQRDQVFQDSFWYEFKKGPGASIGISVFRQSTTDSIYSWHIYINGKLYANAFSEGGAYLTVPYY